MRNNFEHFDERLIDWWNTSQTRYYVDMNIGDKSSVVAISTHHLDWFRSFDPTSTILYFWGQEFNVQELIDEVQKILPKIQEEANKPHWEIEPKSVTE